MPKARQFTVCMWKAAWVKRYGQNGGRRHFTTQAAGRNWENCWGQTFGKFDSNFGEELVILRSQFSQFPKLDLKKSWDEVGGLIDGDPGGVAMQKAPETSDKLQIYKISKV